MTTAAASSGAHLLSVLAAVLLLAVVGRRVARRLGQPQVIGEIAVGLFVGPVLSLLVGPDTLRALVPSGVLGTLKVLGEIGLCLLLVGMALELRCGTGRLRRRTVMSVTAGALIPSLIGGAAVGWWLVVLDLPATRGPSPWPALVLFCAVALSTSAVPVLLRIVEDRGMTGTPAARHALTAAVVIDIIGWVLLAVSVGLARGSGRGVAMVLATTAGAALFALLVGRLLRRPRVSDLAARSPLFAACVLGVGAVAAGLGTERLGGTLVFGAVAFGLAVPADSPAWSRPVNSVTGVGQKLIPVFFVVTGIAVLSSAVGAVSWDLILVVILLAVLAKIAGGWAGAAWGGLKRLDAARTGILLNTRGLTELIVLQAGYAAGVVTSSLFLSLVIMALFTTMLTGPLLTLVDTRDGAAGTATPESADRRPTTSSRRAQRRR